MDRHSFIFRIADIQSLVERHTGYTGKMRVTEKSLDAADRLMLTEGEDFLFNDYMQEAVAETYDWIKAFGRDIPNACRIIPDGTLHVVKENFGVRISVAGVSQPTAFLLAMHPYSAENISRPNWEAEETEETDDYVDYSINCNPFINVEIGDAASVACTLNFRCTVGIEGAPFESKRIISQNLTLTEDTLIEDLTLTLRLNKEDLGRVILKNVDAVEFSVNSITPSEVVTLPMGDFVQYVLSSGNILHGRLIRDYTSGEPVVDAWADTDMRNSVCFEVQLPDWQDRNTLPSVERYLKDAIAFYIIYRWFEIVNPKEADAYFAKFEDKAHKAQLGLNAESTILKRHGHWL